MWKHIINYLLFVTLVSWITACSVTVPADDATLVAPETTLTKPAVTTSLLPTSVPTERAIMAPVSSATPEPTPTSTPTTTPTFTAVPGTVLRSDCPTSVDPTLPPSWLQGSILFSTGPIFSEDLVHLIDAQASIWAISADNSAPQLVHESLSWASISPDGKILLSTLPNEQSDTSTTVLFNMATGEETHLTSSPYRNYSFMTLWREGRAHYGPVIERTEGIGETRTVYIPDPNTQSVEEVVQEFDMPDFAFNDSEVERGLFYGYEAIDPTGQLILYSAREDGNADFEVRLLDLQTGEILWRQKTIHLSDFSPQWSDDGNYATFVVSTSIDDPGNSWWEIVYLTRDGRVMELPPQPFPFVEEGQLITYLRSPDGRYLFYAAMDPEVDTRVRGFIVDVITGKVGEICSPDSAFIASIPSQSQEGHWLPDNQFVYRVLMQKEEQLTHSMRVLDVPSWTSQIVFGPEPGNGVNIFGWTPVEFPREVYVPFPN